MDVTELAERHLLGGLLCGPRQVSGIDRMVHAEEFRSPAHRAIYRCLRDLVAEVPFDALVRADRDAGLDDGPYSEHVFDGGALLYPSTEYDLEEGEVTRLPQAERDTRRAEQQAWWRSRLERQYAVPGVNALAVLDRVQASNDPDGHDVTAAYLGGLIATAPPLDRFDEWGLAETVLDHSIRRRVTQAGLRVGSLAHTSPAVEAQLHAVEQALHALAATHHRWAEAHPFTQVSADAVPTPPPPASETAPVTVAITDPDGGSAYGERRQMAEDSVLGHALRHPELLASTYQSLRPTDFGDGDRGHTFRVLQQEHQRPTARITAASIALQQQRLDPDGTLRHPGVSTGHLHQLATGPLEIEEPRAAADIVLRGHIGRLTQTAATAAQEAAQSAGLPILTVIKDARSGFERVRAAESRRIDLPAVPALAPPAPMPDRDTIIAALHARSRTLREQVIPSDTGEISANVASPQLDPSDPSPPENSGIELD